MAILRLKQIGIALCLMTSLLLGSASACLRIGENIRTDKKGIGKVKLTASGKWYVKFINMKKLTDPKLNYESKWATFTFEIK